ncbi:hypothetical protein Dimus_038194 [Dionaea muscipula]
MSGEDIPPRSHLEGKGVAAFDRARKAACREVGSTSGVTGSSSGAAGESSIGAAVRSGGVAGPVPPVEEDRGDIKVTQHVKEVLADVNFGEDLGDVGDEEEGAGAGARQTLERQRRGRGRGRDRGREGGGGDDEAEVPDPITEELLAGCSPPSRSIIADQHTNAHSSLSHPTRVQPAHDP